VNVEQILAAFAAGGDQLAEAKAALTSKTPAELAALRAEVLKSAAKYSDKAGELSAAEVGEAVAHVEAVKAIKFAEAEHQKLAEQGRNAVAELAELGTDPAGNELRPANPSQRAAQENVEGGENGSQEGGDGAGADKPEGGEQAGEGGDGVQAAGRRLGGRANGLRPQLTAETATVQTLALTGPNAENGRQLDRRGMAEAMAEAIRRVGSLSAGLNGRTDVLRLRTNFPESRVFSSSADALDNKIKLEQLTQQAATADSLVAAGGFCAPLQVLYDIPVIGDVDRPVRDALNRVTADRGGITYRPAVSGVAQTGGIGIWTAANDTASPIVPKSCVEIACPGVVEAEVQAIYKCLTISNMSARFDPEWADSIVQAQSIAYAQKAENELIRQLTVGSTTIQTKQLLGAVRDLLATIDHVVAYYRNVHRLSANRNLRFIAPMWLRDMCRVDLARQMPGDGLQTLVVTDEQVAAWFAARNVAVTWHMDGIDPADITGGNPLTIPPQYYSPVTAGGFVPGFPDVVSTLLFAEGDWLLMDGGTLDLGIIRDSTLVGENKYQTFAEGFEATAFRGIESLHVAMSLQPTGAAAATVSTETITTTVTAPGTAND
jgi:hypothetical protein